VDEPDERIRLGIRKWHGASMRKGLMADMNKIIGKLEDAKTSLEEIRDNSDDDRLEEIEETVGEVIDELEAPNETERE
jgi:hypothetical protein